MIGVSRGGNDQRSKLQGQQMGDMGHGQQMGDMGYGQQMGDMGYGQQMGDMGQWDMGNKWETWDMGNKWETWWERLDQKCMGIGNWELGMVIAANGRGAL